jgi:hypothetical protein
LSARARARERERERRRKKKLCKIKKEIQQNNTTLQQEKTALLLAPFFSKRAERKTNASKEAWRSKGKQTS